MDKNCVGPQDANGHDDQFIVSQKCNEGGLSAWKMNKAGKVESKAEADKCLAAKDDEKITHI